MNEILAARVRAVNLANTCAVQLYPVLAAIFAPLVGQNLLKQGGDILAKYAKLLPEFPNSPKLAVFRHRSDYMLAWTVKTNEVENGLAHYHEVSVYVGELRNGVLTAISPPQELKRDYTAEDVTAARAAYKAAEAIASEAWNKLHPFGEYDR